MKIKREKWEYFKANAAKYGFEFMEGRIQALDKYVKILSKSDYLAVYAESGMQRDVRLCRVGCPKYIPITKSELEELKNLIE